MCGIAGFYNYKILKNPEEVLVSMLSRIKHRGPDESGIYLSKKVGVGSVRLSIIDLSTGTMPLSNSNDTLWIVFNGEIFNYIELREELKTLGYDFKTDSDTEVILNAYDAYGKLFLNKLNGQFAIAIYDKIKDELFLARDRVGIRPLFFTEVEGTFVFGSEIKALMEYPDIVLKIAPKALSQYFTLWTALSPDTLFEGVYEVPPGHFMTIHNGKTQTVQYWTLPICKREEDFISDFDEAKERFGVLFRDAVSLRLRADVPVGAYLSGGLDSSATTAMITEISNENLHTFSIGFENKDFDESDFQQAAVDFFNTKHHAFTCDENEIAGEFIETVWNAEAPLLRTSPVPMKLLAKHVRNHHIKVVITGEGADELLGGYNIFKENKIRRFWAKDPESKYRPLLLKKLYPYLPQLTMSSTQVLKMFFGFKLEQTKSPVYSHLLRWHNSARIKKYLSDRVLNELGDYDVVSEIEKNWSKDLNGCDDLSKAQFIELNLFMSGYLLSSQGDRMAMAHSVEGRYPFLDHRLIEFCMKLHPNLKLRGLNEKYLLKQMIKGKIPEKILKRPKQAYRAPISNVFVSKETPKEIKCFLSKRKVESVGIFDSNKVEQLLNKLTANKQVSEMDHMAITAIVSVQILHDLFVKKSISKLEKADLVQLKKTIIDN